MWWVFGAIGRKKEGLGSGCFENCCRRYDAPGGWGRSGVEGSLYKDEGEVRI